MIKNVFILFCLIVQVSFAQSTIEIDYSYEFIPPEKLIKIAEKEPAVKYQLDVAKKGAKQITVKLVANQEAAYAFVEEIMEGKGVEIRTAMASSGHKYPMYFNLAENHVLQAASENFFPKGKYLIESKLNSNSWKLTKETKEILGYTCHKATTIYKVENSKGKSDHVVTAWYAPELPFQFGPLGYGKLPGMILELKEFTRSFKVKKIVLNKVKEEDIKTPKAEEIISEEDHDKMVNKMIDNKMSN